MTTSSSLPVHVVQPPSIADLSRITGSLFISNALTANNKLILSNNRITSIVNASVEVVTVFFDNIQYLQVPVADLPNTYIYDYFDPIADHIHAVEMRNGRTLVHCAAGVSRSAALCLAYLMKYHAMTLLDAHTWTKSRRPVIRPNSGFWEQLIHYEFKLFSKNTVHMIRSPVGLIPNIYEKEGHFVDAM